MTRPQVPPVPPSDPNAPLVTELLAELREEGWEIPPGTDRRILDHLAKVGREIGSAGGGLMDLTAETFAAFAGKYADRGRFDTRANLYAGTRYLLARYGAEYAPEPAVPASPLEPSRTADAMGTRLPDLPEPLDEQPTSAVQALVNTAAWLDAYDRLALSLAGQVEGEDRERLLTTAGGDGVQDFLRRMARWLQDRPAVAARMWDDVAG
jgi:hypothetical protein